jgi:hypothetical protein
MARHHKSAKPQTIDHAVEQAVAQAMAAALPQIQADVLRGVQDAMPAAAAETNVEAVGPSTEGLLRAVSSVHAGTTQKEILRALLEAGGPFCERIALFVVKSGAASGWQGRGFSDDEAIKDFALDMNCGPVAHAMQHRVAAPANIAEMDRKFADRFGGPANEQVLVLPLRLKEKIAALVYADGGSSGALDASSLELLVMVTGTWLEVASGRKQAQKEDAEGTGTGPAVQPINAHQDPFSGHAPKHSWPMTPATEEAPARVETPRPAPAVEAPVVEAPAAAHAAAAGAATAAAPAVDVHAALSPEDAETHRKAQRFARLLVDEVKLYNQAKVAEGRKHRDLYDRLKEDMEKSRATYQKRFGSTAAASGDYFQKELVRNLAEEDVSVMGPNFKI